MNEYSTTERLEMAYLYYLGIPHEMDRENPKRVIMIFKGDIRFIKGKLKDFWDGEARVDALKILNSFEQVKRLLFGEDGYKPGFYDKKKPSDGVIQQIQVNDMN